MTEDLREAVHRVMDGVVQHLRPHLTDSEAGTALREALRDSYRLMERDGETGVFFSLNMPDGCPDGHMRLLTFRLESIKLTFPPAVAEPEADAAVTVAGGGGG